MTQKILVINTGGTISSVSSPNGYVPKKGLMTQMLQALNTQTSHELPQYDFIELNPLIDSSNITLKDWNNIAQIIESHYSQYIGFVIFHGTDTMAYTASMLSFILENLNKPIILTGSQIPLSLLRNDAIDNIVTSFLLAANSELQEVCIYFNQKLLRGNRSKKISSNQLHAFDSPNYPSLASVDIQLKLKKKNLLPRNKEQSLSRVELKSHSLANFNLLPGMSSELLKKILQPPLQGLILETYGSGNAPNNDSVLINTLERACQQGIIVINCSQCYQATVDMSNYATGQQLLKIGLISGYNMTVEAAFCKLLYLFSKGYPTDKIKQLMQDNLCGELNLPQAY